MEKLISPEATCKWCHINQENPKYGGFDVTLQLPIKSKEAKKWMSEIDGWIEAEVKASGKSEASEFSPYKEDGDNINFKLKQKASFRGKGGEKRDVKIMVVDAELKPCNVDVGWGSTVKVSYSPIPYTVNGKSGVTLYFSAVQVLKLVEYQPEAGGFEKEEGYVSESVQEIPFDSSPKDDSDDF